MKRFLAAIAMMAVAWFVAANPAAAAWPDGPIKLIVGGPAGGSADFVARMVAQRLGDALGQPVVVLNRPGAGGIVAVSTMLAAKPDGNTLILFFADNFTIAPMLFKKPPYDSMKDIDFIGAVARSYPFVVCVNPSVPAQNFDQFIKLAKDSPGNVSFATYGLGSYPHLSLEMMSDHAGVKFRHVPYKGGVESQMAVISGDVNAVAAVNVVEFVKGGKLRPLISGGDKRNPAFPDLPTFKELGYGDQMFGPVIYGVAAPAGLPKEIHDRLATEAKKIAEAPDATDVLAKITTEPYWASGEDLRTILGKAIETYRPIVDRLGLQTE
jgi:tripartite-type tricarboxylate transporter receptor subunit TctC